MTATLSVTPNPATPSSLVSVAGAGFSNVRTRLSLDGAGTSVNIFKPSRGGSFSVGVTVSSTPKTQTLIAEQLLSGIWTEKARTSIVVQAVVPPPMTVSMYLPVYGPGVAMESKDNREIGKSGFQVAHRLIESTDSPVTSIAQNWRWQAPSYSAGNGGRIEITKQLVGADGFPNGQVIGNPVYYQPNLAGGEGEDKRPIAVPSWPSVKGRTVAYVYRNVAPDPLSNWLSLNETCVVIGGTGSNNGDATPVSQPAFTPDFAVLRKSGSWAVFPNLPVCDIGYADGSHDGNGYFQATYVADLSTTPIVSGSVQARQTMLPTKAVGPLTKIAFRVKRLSGSSPATLTIEGGGLSQSVQVPVAGIPISPAPSPSSGGHWDAASIGGSGWLVGVVPTSSLVAGTQYYLRLSCPADTQLMVVPIRESYNIDQAGTFWGSRVFGEGRAEQNRGSGWVPAYEYSPHDWQCYLA